jgi:hypothetical protein
VNELKNMQEMKNFKFCITAILLLAIQITSNAQQKFEHRGYLGWMIDMSRTECHDAWPSIKLDSAMIADYAETLDFLQRSGMNEITLWGLFTNKYWEPEVEKTIDSNRKVMIDQIIHMAHQRKIKVILGMGVYSWGFDKILQEHPELSSSCNAHVLDWSNPSSWNWQKMVFDYTIDNFDFDGISMQSADLGRCNCGESAKMTDLEYHAAINQKAVKYIRSKKPHYIIGISGWGMNFGNPADLKSIQMMTNNVDYLIDVEETSLKEGRKYRQELIKAIAPCRFGNTAVPNVEPIQRLPRNAYFVPTLFHACKNLKDLFADGGLACETYARTRGNSGDKVTIEVIAKILSNPELDVNKALSEVLKTEYQPVDQAALLELSAIFQKAEEAFFTNTRKIGMNDFCKDILLLIPRDGQGIDENFLKAMDSASRLNYLTTMKNLSERVDRLKTKVANQKELNLISDCLKNVLNQK